MAFVLFFSPQDLSQYSLTALETLDNRKKLFPLLWARKEFYPVQKWQLKKRELPLGMDPLQDKQPLAMTAKHSLEGVALVRLLHGL